MSRRKVLITTTSSVDGAKVQRYNGIVSARVVTGTGFFSDFIADFSDVFGGRSSTYQKQLKSIYDEVVELLKAEAAKVNANAILGVRIDHDEISGKGKQMFMVTATGTAAVVDDTVLSQAEEAPNLAEISSERLEYELQKARMIREIRQDPNAIPQRIDYFIQNGAEEALEDIIRYFVQLEFPDSFKPKAVEYVQAIESRSKLYLYQRLYSERFPIKILLLLSEARMIDYSQLNEFILSMPFNVQKAGLRYLMSPMSSYTPEALTSMETIKATLAGEFKDRGKALDGDKWECECGKANKTSSSYCKSCGRDIRGFEEDQTRPEEVIHYIEERQSVLRKFFEPANG